MRRFFLSVAKSVKWARMSSTTAGRSSPLTAAFSPASVPGVGLVVATPRPPQVHGHADGAVHQLLALGGDAEHVGDEELRDVLLVVVVDLERAVEPAHRVAHGRLGLDEDERQAVDEQHEVRASLGGPGAEGELARDDVLVVLEVLEVDEANGDVLVVRPEGHRAVAAQPRGQLLVGLEEAVGAHREHDGAQLVEHLVGAVGNGGDLGVEPDERVADPVLDEDLVRLARDVRGREVVPAEARELAALAREAGADGGVVGDAAAEQVADEVLDGGGFGEGHCDASTQQWLTSRCVRAADAHARRRSLPVATRGLEPLRPALLCSARRERQRARAREASLRLALRRVHRSRTSCAHERRSMNARR